MVSRPERDVWTEAMRRRAAGLRAWLVRRFGGTAVWRPPRAPLTARPAAGPRPDPFAGLRYYPAFVLLGLGSFLFVAGPLMGALIHALDQVLVPRLHPVDLRPGDRIEVGSSGAYRPVRVRHPDGSVTDAGEMPGYLSALRILPAVVPVGLGWLLGMYRLARRWPKASAEPGGPAESPGAGTAEPGAAADRAGIS